MPAGGNVLNCASVGLHDVEIVVQVGADERAGELDEIGTLGGPPRAFRQSQTE